MAQSLADRQSSDLTEIKSRLGLEFTWKGTNYACLPSGFSKAKTLEPGGMGVEADLILIVNKSLFSAGVGPFPNDSGKDKITYKARGYRIENVITNETDTFLKLVCVSDKKGV